MDLRDSKSRLILIVAALGAALVIAVASCGGGGDGGDDSSESSGNSSDQQSSNGDESVEETGEESGEDPEEVLAEVTGEEEITLTFTRAEREEGGFLTVEGTIYNGGDETWFRNAWYGSEEELAGNGFSMAGATLVAQAEGKRYLILRDTSGRCLCTGFGSGIEAGDTVSWFAQFPEPDPATTQVDFQIGNMPPATLEIQ